MEFRIRAARGSDSAAAAAVVESVFHEYGFTWEADGYCADLYDLENHYLKEGAFWVAETETGILATCGLEVFDRLPDSEEGLIRHGGKVRVAGADCSLERLYVHPDARRLGLGGALLDTAIAEARQRGRSRMEIWSDVLLTKAHAMYERWGAVRLGQRLCDDPDNSLEWGMKLDLVD